MPQINAHMLNGILTKPAQIMPQASSMSLCSNLSNMPRKRPSPLNVVMLKPAQLMRHLCLPATDKVPRDIIPKPTQL